MITWVAIFGLLVLRLLIGGWIPFKDPSATWADPTYEIGTYILVTFLIWWEWKNLKEYHMNPLAILILIIFPPLSKIILHFFTPTNALSFPKFLSFLFFIIAVVLIYLVMKNKLDFRIRLGKDMARFAISAILGLLLASLETILMIKFMGFPKNTFPGLLALASPIYQLGYAASPEEPLFRGFLWGGLRKLKINETWILFIQALLFAMGHIFYTNSTNGLFFLGLIFLGALVMGVLVWWTRSLSSSIAFHAFFNGSAIFLYWIELLVK